MPKLKHALLALFNKSISTFFVSEAENILSGVSERNLCGRLAIYLEEIKNEFGFSNYYCDTEYNRKQNGQIKTIIDNDLQIINISCDLILHSRGHNLQKDNLLAIEMKKFDRPELEKESDKKRLSLLTKQNKNEIWSYDGEAHPDHVCGYVYGIYIEINRLKRNYIIECYHDGAKAKEWSSSF